MSPHEINTLIERYFDGQTTPAEERELALAVQQEGRPAEWAIVAEMLGELTTDTAIYDEIMAQRALKPAKRSTRLWPWAAAACICIALGLSYNLLKETPQEMAMVESHHPARTLPKHKPATEQKPIPEQKPTPASPEEPPSLVPEQPPAEPLLAEEQVPTDDSPLASELRPAVVPHEVAEAAETSPSDDLALCMDLIAEVEARTFMLQQEASQQDSPPFNAPECGERSEWNFLLDELLTNIQLQSNRPELSL